MKRNVKAVSLALSAVTAVQSMQFVPAVIYAAEPDHAAVVSDTILSGAEYNIVNKLSGKLITAFLRLSLRSSLQKVIANYCQQQSSLHKLRRLLLVTT